MCSSLRFLELGIEAWGSVKRVVRCLSHSESKPVARRREAWSESSERRCSWFWGIQLNSTYIHCTGCQFHSFARHDVAIYGFRDNEEAQLSISGTYI